MNWPVPRGPTHTGSAEIGGHGRALSFLAPSVARFLGTSLFLGTKTRAREPCLTKQKISGRRLTEKGDWGSARGRARDRVLVE